MKDLGLIENDLEIAKGSDPSFSPIMFDPLITYKPRISYPQALNAPFPSKKYKQRDDILETFKQVKVRLPLLQTIRQMLAYAKFLKNMFTFKRKS